MLRMVIPDLYLGGAETFFLRFGIFGLSKGEKVSLFCEKIHSLELEGEFKKAHIEVKLCHNACKDAMNDVSTKDTVLTLILYNFLECESIAKAKGICCKILYYVVLPSNPLHTTKSKLFNKFSFRIYREMLWKYIYNGNMLFMDELCTNEWNRFYGLSIPDENQHIMHLPMEILPVEDGIIEKKACERHEAFNILSVARSEFPFKGYLKGLIEVYCKLKQRYVNVTLTLVSSGAELSVLKEWIREAEQEGAKDILLMEDVKPANLFDVYKKASLYVGMGTTLLEAVNCCVPALPVEAYMYELKSEGFFCDAPEVLGVFFGRGKDASPYIEKVLCFTDQEYTDLTYRCRELLEIKYDIRRFYDKILNRSVNVEKHFVTPLCHYENKIRRMLHSRN